MKCTFDSPARAGASGVDCTGTSAEDAPDFEEIMTNLEDFQGELDKICMLVDAPDFKSLVARLRDEFSQRSDRQVLAGELGKMFMRFEGRLQTHLDTSSAEHRRLWTDERTDGIRPTLELLRGVSHGIIGQLEVFSVTNPGTRQQAIRDKFAAGNDDFELQQLAQAGLINSLKMFATLAAGMDRLIHGNDRL